MAIQSEVVKAMPLAKESNLNYSDPVLEAAQEVEVEKEEKKEPELE